MLGAGDVRVPRDATRGGIASVLNELAEASGVSMLADEGAILVLPPVRAACEMLGLDPLYVANEGVCVAIVAPEDAEGARRRSLHAGGADAALVGEVLEGPPRVGLRNRSGCDAPAHHARGRSASDLLSTPRGAGSEAADDPAQSVLGPRRLRPSASRVVVASSAGKRLLEHRTRAFGVQAAADVVVAVDESRSGGTRHRQPAGSARTVS